MDEVINQTDVATPEVATVSLPAEMAPASEPFDPWKKVRKLALRQLDRFISLEPKVLQGDDPEAIHDIRVASRRLQQILDLLHPQPRPREIRRLRRKIRRTRRALGEVRNCDVQLQRVTRYLASKRTARRDCWEAIQHYLRQRRSQGFDKATRKLSKLNLTLLYVNAKELLSRNGATPPGGHRGHHHAVATGLGPEQFGERTLEALERVWKAFNAQVMRSRSDPRMAVIHAVRIAAKRLRYLIEVFHAFDVPGSAQTLARLRGLQQLLGDWHDLEVLEQMMIEMVARPDFLRTHLELAMGIEKLILRTRSGKARYQEKYHRATQAGEGYEEIKEWVSNLLALPPAAFPRDWSTLGGS
jgi:CHAD domain-containing protein